MTTVWKALCEELLGLWDAQPLPPYESSWASVIARARRALLAQPEHEVASPTQDELWELWLRLDRELPDRPAAVAAFWEHAQVEARACWGRPAPAPAGEVAELVEWLRDHAYVLNPSAERKCRRICDLLEQRQAAPVPAGEVAELVAALRIESSRCTCTLLTTDDLRRAADLLEQRHPAPVPVAERLPGPEDCHFNPGAEVGSCWCFNPVERLGGIAWWSFEPLEWSESATHWLPFHALPLPAGEMQP